MTLTEVCLPCGCLCLCDSDGPCCVLEPCPKYPDAGPQYTCNVPADWQEKLARSRLLQKARQKRRYHRRKFQPAPESMLRGKLEGKRP